jgi:hypothetical protein
MNPRARLYEAFRLQLAPEGPLEDTYADEIISAAWRLRMCADDDDKTRNSAHRILRTSMAELRRLQTDRQIRREMEPDAPQTGLAGYREVHAARKASAAPENANWVCSVKTNAAPATTPAARPAVDAAGSQNTSPTLHQAQSMPKAA